MTLSSGQVTHKNTLNSTDPWIWLIELRHSDTEAYRFAFYTQNVTFEGDVYYAYDGRISSISQSTDSRNENISLTITNAGQALAAPLDTNKGFRDKKLVIKLVDSSNLADAAAIEQEFSIVKTSVKWQNVSFILGGYELYAIDIPRQLYLRTKCRFTYRDKDGVISTECGYQETSTGAGLATCDKGFNTLNGCVAHGLDEEANGFEKRHPRDFGGFRGITAVKN